MRECNMKKVQHAEKFNMERVQDEKCATRKSAT